MKKLVNEINAYKGPSIKLFRTPLVRNGILIPTKIIESKGVA